MGEVPLYMSCSPGGAKRMSTRQSKWLQLFREQLHCREGASLSGTMSLATKCVMILATKCEMILAAKCETILATKCEMVLAMKCEMILATKCARCARVAVRNGWHAVVLLLLSNSQA